MSSGGRYLHQQMGWLTILVVLVGGLFVYIAFASTGLSWLGYLGLAVPILVAFLFGSLTVDVDRQRVHIRFGVGLIRRTWKLKDIASAERVRNPWWTGWGIRILPGRTVYNVAGFDAVEITLHDGRCYRIGTDDPEGLERAIRARLK
ncbi:MAG: hypothetical protein U5Q44_04450 [Dehalococcoidia bacterium]|nr:hypothetical protein [Dehalococcoidia bacterium]